MIAVVCGALWFAFRLPKPEFYRFEGLSGPAEATVVPEPIAPKLADFAFPGEHRLAVLVTDPESDWLGLVRTLEANGVPYTMETDPARAMRQAVVIAYPSISGKLLSRDQLRALADHVRAGGTLLTFDLAGGGLEPLFGASRGSPSRSREMIQWLGRAGAVEDSRTYFSAPASEAKVGSYALEPTNAEVLAQFDDGTVAATCRRVGGRACLLGLDFGALAERAMNGRGAQVSGTYVNSYHPSLDVLTRFVKDLYVEGDDRPYLIDTARRGTEGTLVLTHDVDYQRSIINAETYADALRERGVSGTFFIQTKYVKDWNDEIFFDQAGVAALRRMMAGMEIGSHSVSHSRTYSAFDFGDGTEAYPDYLPFVSGKTSARGGTVLGELRVSKFLLENASGRSIRSFRPGHLSYPERLPEALAATGYSYDSTLTAALAMTHLPFRLTYSRSEAGLLPVYEIPLTIEDERDPPMMQRFDATVDIVNKIAAHRGVAVLLNHPDRIEPKLGFETRLVDRFKDRLWVTSIGAFGDWWRARTQADVRMADGALVVRSANPLSGVDAVLPKDGNRRVPLDGPAGERRVDM